MIRARLLALLFVLSPALHAQDYCLALRGNGELMPAHWGAMANLVEKMGLPVAQSGGSSASITLMMNEAVAANKFLARVSGQEQKNRAALLYKSFEGFAEFLTTTPEWRDFITLYTRAKSVGGNDWMNELQKILEQASKTEEKALQTFLAQNLELLKKNYRTGVRLGLISEKNYEPLFSALKRLSEGGSVEPAADLVEAKFYADELKETIRVFGAFNAETDANLFFRAGLVDFSRFAEQMGRMAQFYSGPSNSSSDDVLWEDFFRTCGDTNGQLWSEIGISNRDCHGRFNGIVESFLKSPLRPNFGDRNAGLTIKSFPTTSVLVDEGATEALAALKKYGEVRDSKFGAKFFLKDAESVKFGYWGDPESLSAIEARLPKASDEKSRRFLSLGAASWKKILALSPAEPGLASLQAFQHDGKEIVSAGGWSDLHPVMVLRAAGCARVVYVTRRGGESPFAQGVAKRLFSSRENDPAAQELLRKLYDLNNPESSMRQSLDQADAVLCTDWNRFNIKDGMKDMIRDSYRASPYFVRNHAAFSEVALLPQLSPRNTTAEGKPVYEGCF
jgi:hypothetical protein